MSKEQIEEMARAIDEFCQKELGTEFNDDILTNFAENLYAKGYRKQSEGEWKPYKDYFTKIQVGWICSKCSSVRYNLSDGDTDFCPNCGAKMEGGE